MERDTKIGIIAGLILAVPLCGLSYFLADSPSDTPRPVAPVAVAKPAPTTVFPALEIVDNYGNVIGKIREVKP
jgi:peptidoglycan/LPS O-acetylase OafA/YrhL